jgi:hypothetical protein
LMWRRRRKEEEEKKKKKNVNLVQMRFLFH